MNPTPTPVTAREQADQIAAIANLALAQHLVDHRLPIPTDITPPIYTDEDRTLNVRIAASDLRTWIDSVHVDDVTTEDRDNDVFGPWTLTSYAVRLPDTGTRITITSTAAAAPWAVAQ